MRQLKLGKRLENNNSSIILKISACRVVTNRVNRLSMTDCHSTGLRLADYYFMIRVLNDTGWC